MDARSRDDRSRSPLAGSGRECGACWRRDDAVQFFHEADPASPDALHVYLPEVASAGGGLGPSLLQSHGWLDGTLHKTFHEQAFDPDDMDSWPLVRPASSLLFTSRRGERPGTPGPLRRVPPRWLRAPSAEPPRLSLLFVRQSSELIVEHQGKYGCPPSDLYMSSFVRLAMMAHPWLTRGAPAPPNDFEVFAAFVSDSGDLERLASAAPAIASRLRGERRTGFWMLWPTEWEDCGASTLGYVERAPFFRAMRACEAAGLRSGFPHPADQYELIASKSWMAALSADPFARSPAAVPVVVADALRDLRHAARQALAELELLRQRRPLPRGAPGAVAPEEGAAPPALAAANERGVVKGVVKLGWSWEAKDVLVFSGEDQLSDRLEELLTCQCFHPSACFVQEWVDFDFEMRLFFLPAVGWTPAQRRELLPARVEYNAWAEAPDEAGRPRGFRILDKAECLARWDHDEEALRSAEQQAVEVSQHLIAWLSAGGRADGGEGTVTAQVATPSAIRMDFMLRRVPGAPPRVVFGEFCEAGAEVLGWSDGCKAMWRASLDHVLS